jgi:hypothetical protein
MRKPHVGHGLYHMPEVMENMYRLEKNTLSVKRNEDCT